MSEGPFKAAFDADIEGVVRREIITYRYRNGSIVKEVASRAYHADGDYIDSQTIQPMPELRKV
jgi:hypothetical protein